MEIIKERRGEIATFFICLLNSVGNIAASEQITGKIRAVDETGGIEIDDDGETHLLNWAYVVRVHFPLAKV